MKSTNSSFTGAAQLAAAANSAAALQATADSGPEYVVEAASLSYCEASMLLRNAMDEARRAMFISPSSGNVADQGFTPRQQRQQSGGGHHNNSNNAAAAATTMMTSPRSGVEALQEAYAGRLETLERQLNEALGQRAGLERALHHAAADALRAQNDLKLAKQETHRIQQQLILTEAELHKKVEELAKRPASTVSGLAADDELRMRHEMAVLRAEIALLSDLVNRTPDQQMQLLQRKVSELTSDAMKAAEAAKQREGLLNELHVRHQAAMERVAYAEDKRDAALSRCATLEDDNAALHRTLEDTMRSLRHQTQCAQTFAAALTKQIIAHEAAARGAVGRDQAIQERELALYGAGLKTRSLLEASERQSALRAHLLRELATDITSCYAKDRTASRYFAKWHAFCLKRRMVELRDTQSKLATAIDDKKHAETMAQEAERRSTEIGHKLKTESEAKVAKIRADFARDLQEIVVANSSVKETTELEREAVTQFVALLREEFGGRYELALQAATRERNVLVMLANQGMINLRDILTKEAVDREAVLIKQLEDVTADLQFVKSAANNALRETEKHGTVMERALLEAKRQREKQEADFKANLEQQQRAFNEKARAEAAEVERKLAAQQREANAALQQQQHQSQQELSAKERKALADAAEQRKALEARDRERAQAFQQLQDAMADAARDVGAASASSLPHHNNQQQEQLPAEGLVVTDESVARERLRRKWLVENIKQVVDSLEQCYLDDVQSCFGDGLEPTAISNLRTMLIRRANHTTRVLGVWQKRESMLRAFLQWMSVSNFASRRKLRQHASRSIQDLSQKLTKVKDIAQAAIGEKKSIDAAFRQLESEFARQEGEMQQLQADYDGLRRSHAMRKAEALQLNSPSRGAAQQTATAQAAQAADEETRSVLASARAQIEQLAELLRKSRESEERYARTIEEMSGKLNLETAAAAELKQTIVALLSQAEDSGATIMATKSEKTSESLFVLEDRPKLMRDLISLVQTLRDDPKAARAVAESILQTHATESERRLFGAA